MQADDVKIEIAYATPDLQMILELQVAAESTPREAVQLSNIDDYFPEIDKLNCDIGIFGKVIRGAYTMDNGDRIEIYRPLLADPKEVRKRRAAEGMRMKKGGGKDDVKEVASGKEGKP